uniref:Uncharacterized protein n=1 Tax=Panagrolaimus sp. ES5 TaxID=591445 RepID=A0AC34FZG8_9BILA
MLDIEEQYSLAFSFPEALNAIKLIPLFVPRTQKHFQKNSQKTFEFNTVINDEIFSQNPNLKFLNSSIFNLGHVSLYYSTTPAQNLLQLLSPKTRIIKCKRVTFSSTLKFCEILQKSQNLETLDIKTTNVVTDNLWLEDLIRWSRGDLKYVSLTVPNLEFDIKFLVTFMKTKPNLQLYIYLQVDTSIPFNDIENLKSFTKKISTYFLPFNFCVNNQSCLSLSFINEHQRSDIYISQCYKLLESK